MDLLGSAFVACISAEEPAEVPVPDASASEDSGSALRPARGPAMCPAILHSPREVDGEDDVRLAWADVQGARLAARFDALRELALAYSRHGTNAIGPLIPSGICQ